MSQPLFGTDGIRGEAGDYPLDRPTVTALGREAARKLAGGGRRPVVVLAGDSRASTPALCAWLVEGLAAAGAEVRYAGLLPTPGVAWLVRQLGADAGIAVSASHNPHPDNGIKLFDGDGFKWGSGPEREIEERLPAPAAAAVDDLHLAPPQPEAGLAKLYLGALAASLPGERPLAGLAVALDAANGAAAPYAEGLFQRLGARVSAIGNTPDGRNINLGCGSTAPAGLAAVAVERGAALGFAFDGDADRAVFVDEQGEVRDGDDALYIWATHLHHLGRLRPPRIVATSMSNLGLERALAETGIGVERCGVGDREVVETMRREGLRLGGEQSGHLIDLELATTGDGLLTALQLAAIVQRSGRGAAELLRPFRRYPQVLLNVRVARKPALAGLPAVVSAAREVEQSLGEEGRLVLRYSGTEPLARVMIEGPDSSRITALAEELAAVIASEIGAPEAAG